MAFFNDFFEQNAKGVHDFSDTDAASGYYMMLLSSVPVGTEAVKADIVSNEITGTGYTAGGVHLADIAVSETGGVATVDVTTDPSWDNGGSGATFTARAMAVYRKGSHGGLTDPLVVYEDFGSDVSVTGSTFTYTVNASGLLTNQASA